MFPLSSDRSSSASSAAVKSLWFSMPTLIGCRSMAGFIARSWSRHFRSNADHSSRVLKLS